MSKSEFNAGYCELCGWERTREQRLKANKSASARAKQTFSPKATGRFQPAPKTEKVQVQQQFELRIDSAGYIQGEGFWIQNGDYQTSRFIDKHVIILTNGEVYAGKGIINTIASHASESAPSKTLKVGRAKLHLITETFINYLLERNEYPARSQREQEVSDRNLNLIVWLASKAGI
jgi:hypothetical protein